MFLKNKNIIFKIRRSKVTDYAALKTKMIIIYGLGCKGAYTAGQYVFVECA